MKKLIFLILFIGTFLQASTQVQFDNAIIIYGEGAYDQAMAGLYIMDGNFSVAATPDGYYVVQYLFSRGVAKEVYENYKKNISKILWYKRHKLNKTITIYVGAAYTVATRDTHPIPHPDSMVISLISVDGGLAIAFIGKSIPAIDIMGQKDIHRLMGYFK